jgi:hypothetical protein
MTQPATRKGGKSRYLILGFSLDTAFDGQQNAPPKVVCTTGFSSARILAFDLPYEEPPAEKNLGQWRLAIEVNLKDSSAARRVFSGFEALLTRVYHGLIDDLAMEPLPTGVMKGRRIRLARFISSAGQRAQATGVFSFQRSADSRIRSYFQTAHGVNAFVLYQLPTVLQSEALFSACSFFQSCCSEYAFVGDSISDALRRRRKVADLERERQSLEAVVLNSFRVVEAIVGEPGKDRDKFRKRMATKGLDFDERVGFRGSRRKAFGEEIYRLQELRDSTSAHGIRRRKHPVTFFEAMRAQHLAESLLHQVLWQECCRTGRPYGTPEELAYLLELMYPFCADSGWLTRAFTELEGKTPIQASMEPGGPAKVQRLAEVLSRQTPRMPKPQVFDFIPPNRKLQPH